MDITKIPSPNFTKGRDGYDITAIVLHITEGSTQSALDWFQDPTSQVASHFLIADTSPYIIQMVEEEDTAWHAGVVVRPKWKGLIMAPLGGIEEKQSVSEHDSFVGEKGEDFIRIDTDNLGGQCVVVNPNKHTLGVEVALRSKTLPKWKQWMEWAGFIKYLAQKHNVPMDKIGLPHHNEIRADKTCPSYYITRFYLSTLKNFI